VAHQVLERLTREGVIERRRAGTAYLYSLNRNRYVVTEILEPAFRNEARWLERLGEEVLAALRPSAESVVLYGSWAREVATPRSDVDLLLVVTDGGARETVERRVDELRGRLGERFGRFISVLGMTAEEVRAKLRAGDRLVRSIVSEGRVLAGRSLAEIAAGG
jgi:predicted nucleotidyltransferase